MKCISNCNCIDSVNPLYFIIGETDGYIEETNEILKLHVLTVIVRSVFKEDGKYYTQVFLDECLYEL